MKVAPDSARSASSRACKVSASDRADPVGLKDEHPASHDGIEVRQLGRSWARAAP